MDKASYRKSREATKAETKVETKYLNKIIFIRNQQVIFW